MTRITVQGNQRMSRGEVLGLLDGLSGASIVMTDLEGWRQKLLASPWVADASIRRMFPGTLDGRDRGTSADGHRAHQGPTVSDRRTGAVIDEFGPNYADLDLPIIDGLAATEGEDESVDEARAALAGRLMSELARRPTLAGQVSQIDVTDVRNAVVILKGDTALLRVGDERFLGALAVLSRSDAGAAGADAGHRLRGSALRPAGLRQAAERPPARFSASARQARQCGGRAGRDGGASVGAARPAARTGRSSRGSKRAIRSRARRRHLDGHLRRRRKPGGRQPQRRRYRGVGVSRHQARRGRQSRGGGGLDQEGDRGSRVDGAASKSTSCTSRSRVRTSRVSTAAVSSRSRARTAK